MPIPQSVRPERLTQRNPGAAPGSGPVFYWIHGFLKAIKHETHAL